MASRPESVKKRAANTTQISYQVSQSRVLIPQPLHFLRLARRLTPYLGTSPSSRRSGLRHAYLSRHILQCSPLLCLLQGSDYPRFRVPLDRDFGRIRMVAVQGLRPGIKITNLSLNKVGALQRSFCLVHLA